MYVQRISDAEVPQDSASTLLLQPFHVCRDVTERSEHDVIPRHRSREKILCVTGGADLTVRTSLKNMYGLITTTTKPPPPLPPSHSSSIFRMRPSGLFHITINLEIWSYWQSVGLLRRGIRPSQGRYLYKQTKSEQPSIPRMGFEPMIPVFEREKTFHALDRAAPVIYNHLPNIYCD
jgi:hypothetical protein